jgi:hypothetical protein
VVDICPPPPWRPSPFAAISIHIDQEESTQAINQSVAENPTRSSTDAACKEGNLGAATTILDHSQQVKISIEIGEVSVKHYSRSNAVSNSQLNNTYKQQTPHHHKPSIQSPAIPKQPSRPSLSCQGEQLCSSWPGLSITQPTLSRKVLTCSSSYSGYQATIRFLGTRQPTSSQNRPQRS